MSAAHTYNPFSSAMKKPRRTEEMLTMPEKTDSFDGDVIFPCNETTLLAAVKLDIKDTVVRDACIRTKVLP
jgi:hypothetical protein